MVFTPLCLRHLPPRGGRGEMLLKHMTCFGNVRAIGMTSERNSCETIHALSVHRLRSDRNSGREAFVTIARTLAGNVRDTVNLSWRGPQTWTGVVPRHPHRPVGHLRHCLWADRRRKCCGPRRHHPGCRHDLVRDRRHPGVLHAGRLRIARSRVRACQEHRQHPDEERARRFARRGRLVGRSASASPSAARRADSSAATRSSPRSAG